jgi:hypothetical protein
VAELSNEIDHQPRKDGALKMDYALRPITPPSASAETDLLILICSMFGIMLIGALIYHIVFRKRPVTPEEFGEANDRIIARVPLLKTRRGEDLRWLCRAISLDLRQVTSFVDSDVRRCIRQYHLATFRNFRRLAPLVALIHENEMLRREAIQIEILYRIKPFRRAMVGLTNESASRFSTSWLSLLARYCSENLQHGRF